MKYLLDTNVISEIRKTRRAHPQVLQWWKSIHASQVFLSVMTLGELQQGIVKLQKRDREQARFLETWVNGLLVLFHGRVLQVDHEIAKIWAKLQSQRTLPVVDCLLAATAIRHKLVFVTRNTKDIQDTGVRYLNPFNQ